MGCYRVNLYTNISFSDLLCGDHCGNNLFGSDVCTVLAFVIYMQVACYLLHSLENKKDPHRVQ